MTGSRLGNGRDLPKGKTSPAEAREFHLYLPPTYSLRENPLCAPFSSFSCLAQNPSIVWCVFWILLSQCHVLGGSVAPKLSPLDLVCTVRTSVWAAGASGWMNLTRHRSALISHEQRHGDHGWQCWARSHCPREMERALYLESKASGRVSLLMLTTLWP
jgi:hypothetical protein